MRSSVIIPVSTSRTYTFHSALSPAVISASNTRRPFCVRSVVICMLTYCEETVGARMFTASE